MKKIVVLLLVITGAFVILSGASANSGTEPEVTFERDVASVFQSRCVACHQAGGSAPMSLATYGEARPWARAIKEKVITHAMPPFYAAGPVGYYENDTRLTKNEIDTIVRWVDSGAPRGNPSDRPASRDRVADNHQPDLYWPDGRTGFLSGLLNLPIEQWYRFRFWSASYRSRSIQPGLPHRRAALRG